MAMEGSRGGEGEVGGELWKEGRREWEERKVGGRERGRGRGRQEK